MWCSASMARASPTVADLKREVARAGHSVALLIQREEAQIYIPVDLG